MHAIHGRKSTLGTLGAVTLALLLGACNDGTSASVSPNAAATAPAPAPAPTDATSGSSSLSSPANASSTVTETTNMPPATTPIFIGTSTPVAHVAPAIAGTPSTIVTVGTSYQFQPAVSVADTAAQLTFSIQGKPSWLTFSSTTGLLSGTPTTGDLGTYSSIAISVSDGTALATLASFSISVNQIATGSATLTWAAPTQNTDGSALTDLAGYVIHYGRSAAALTQQITIGSAGTLRYVVGNLDPGTWYFAVTSVNSANLESTLSPTVNNAI